MFSILIPTWNNLEMLKCCIEAIRQNSTYPHEIILHINEGSDGTVEWANTVDAGNPDNIGKGVAYTLSAENIGICKAMNAAFSKATKNLIVYLNDDMYVLPNWDKFLLEEIQTIDNQHFMLSSTLIEPTPHGYPCMIYGDYGRDIPLFEKEKLLAEYQNFKMNDWYGASWPPFVVSREAWEKIGGFSEEFSPGMYSDPDFSMKLWQIGCRIFKGLGQSRVYHFQSRSTGRIQKNDGRRQFMQKWGLPASAFYKHYLRMGERYEGVLKEPNNTIALFFEKMKAVFYK
jgi:glycosyltransferase involved in cell wall biosynthesis